MDARQDNPYPVEHYPQSNDRGNNHSIRLFIVDDHSQFRNELSQALRAEPDILVCGEADDADTASSGAVEFAPDVLLIELEMTGVDGVETMRRIIARQPYLRVILMSLHSDAERVLEGLRAGALAHISKFAHPDEFAHAIRAVQRGEAWIDTQTTERVLREIRRSYTARGV